MTIPMLYRLLPRSEYPSAVYALWALGGLGFALRIAVALFSTGSNDILLWSDFGRGIAKVGVARTYELVEHFNHPPLIGYLAAAIWRVTQLLDLSFAVTFKAPMILADLLTTLLLWKIWKDASGPLAGGWAVVAFSWSVVAILVSAFHANTDSLCASLCLLSAYTWEKKMPLAAGLALAAALNVKLIPVVLLPAFLLSSRTWRELLWFGAGLTLSLLPFLPFLICCGASFYRNAIAYESNVDHWGIMFLLLQGEAYPPLARLAGEWSERYLVAGRFLVLALASLLGAWAWFSRRWNHYELGAICFAIFLVFTPGFGLQYTVYAVPFLCAVSPRWAHLYSTLAGLFLGLVYYIFWTGTVPAHSLITARFPMLAALFGLMAWVLLISFLVSRLRRPPVVSSV